MQTQLYNEYQKFNGKIIDFHGWKMPIHFSGIMDEHQTVRERVGIFDVSHMGTLLISGENAGKQLQGLCTNDIMSMDIGKSVYTHILNDDGNIIDDNIIFRTGKEEYMIMPNASMIDIIFNWIQDHIGMNHISTDHIDITDIKETDLEEDINPSPNLQNLSNEYSTLAVQGPKSMELLTHLFGETILDIPKFNFAFYKINTDSSGISTISDMPSLSDISTTLGISHPSDISSSSVINKQNIYPPLGGFPGFETPNTIMVSRTGYTGEDGVELITRNKHIVALWREIIFTGEEYGIKPIGLGARDTLRLEMGYLLSGQDFDGSHTPLESNCSWVVKWDHEFIGKEHLLKQKEEKTYQRLVGVVLDTKAAARPGAEVFALPVTPPSLPPAAPPLVPVETKGSPPHQSPEITEASASEEVENEPVPIGLVTSGNYSPTLGKAVALVRIDRKYAKAGTPLTLQQGKRKFNGVVTRSPFIKNK